MVQKQEKAGWGQGLEVRNRAGMNASTGSKVTWLPQADRPGALTEELIYSQVPLDLRPAPRTQMESNSCGKALTREELVEEVGLCVWQ